MKRSLLTVVAIASITSPVAAQVFPTAPHAAFNFIPFGAGGAGFQSTQHQVFLSTLFGANPVQITKIGFAPNNALAGSIQNLGDVVIRLGYTNATPGLAGGAGGLDVPTVGGGGAPNAVGPMANFFSATAYSYTVISGGTANFEMVFTGAPFTYNPAQGNLLVEIVCSNTANTTMSVSRSAGTNESSRAYSGGLFGSAALGTTATRMNFTLLPVATCYPDCNGDGVLGLADFGCFQTKFALGDPYADCNGDGVLGLADFGCFQTKFALGCP